MNKNHHGFSLIEILLVVGIIALIASVTVPVVRGNKDKANYEVSVIQLREIGKAMEKHYLERGKYPVFADWNALSAEESPLLEYINEVPKADAWGRDYKVIKSTETEYEFEGLSIPSSKLASDYPDYVVQPGAKIKKKGEAKREP